MLKPERIKANKQVARKILNLVDQGLCFGIGKPIPGQMCVEAAVCYAMGLPHGDEPVCVAPSVRKLKIRLNDANWSSNHARAKGMRRLAIAQLNTAGELDELDFAKRVTLITIVKVVPRSLRHAARIHPDKKHKDALERAAVNCERNPTADAAHAAAKAAHAAYAAAHAAYAAANAAFAASNAANAAFAASNAANAAFAASNAAYAATNAAHAASYAAKDASYAAKDADVELSFFAEEVVQVLIDMKAPGTKWLNLTEEL